MNADAMIAKVQKVRSDIETAKQNEYNAKLAVFNEVCDKIKSRKVDVADLMRVYDAIVDNDFNADDLCSNGISHQFGFVYKMEDNRYAKDSKNHFIINGIGVEGGGYAGSNYYVTKDGEFMMRDKLQNIDVAIQRAKFWLSEIDIFIKSVEDFVANISE